MSKLKSFVDSLENIYDIPHTWNEDYSCITFHKKDNTGFDISISDENNKIIGIETDKGIHNHYHIENLKLYEDELTDIFGLVRDMLTKNMRIREISKNNKPVKSILEYYENNKWHSESIVSLLFYNFWGKKTETIYTNDILPIRKFNS